jgi:hypothetical protein
MALSFVENLRIRVRSWYFAGTMAQELLSTGFATGTIAIAISQSLTTTVS